MADRIKGITIEIGGDTTGLSKALNGVNSEIRNTQSQLKDVERLLKLDPTNTELLAQKQKLLTDAIDETKKKLDELKRAEEQVKQQFEQGKVNQEQYDALKREIIATEQSLKTLEKQAAQTNATVAKITEAAKGMKEFGEAATSAGKKMLPATAAITGAGVAAVKSADDLKTAVNEYLSATGDYASATADAAAATEELEEMFSRIYKSNYGESLEDVAAAAATVRTNIQNLGSDELEKVTENALLLRDTFEYDVAESTRAADTLMKQFGISADDAFSLIVQGAQSGLDYSGELLDNIDEYSVHFQKMGLGAEDMFNIFASGAENGAWNLDKIGDAIKELSIRVIDGSDTTVAGFEAAGLSADEMAAKFGEGGDTAKDAFRQTLKGLKSIEDPIARNTAGVNLFGTMWEDLGEQVVLSMGDSEGAIDAAADAIENLREQRYDDLKTQLASVGRTVTTDIAVPIGQQLVPKIQAAVEKIAELVRKFSELSPRTQSTIIAITALVAAIGPLLIIIGQVSTGIGAIMSLVGTLGPVLAALGAAGGPILLVVGALTALNLILDGAKNSTNEYYTAAVALSEAEQLNKEKVDALSEAYTAVNTARESATASILSETQHEQALFQELQSITDENGKVNTKNEERARFILGELSEALGTELKMTGDQILNYQELCGEIDTLIQKKQANALLSANEDAYAQAIKNQTDAFVAYTQAQADCETVTRELEAAKLAQAEAEAAIQSLLEENIRTGIDVSNETATWNEKLADATATVQGCEEKLVGLNETLAKAQEEYVGYNTTIANYEGLSSAIISGDQAAISEAILKTANDFQTAETGTRDSLERQVQTLTDKYEKMRLAVEMGAPGVTQEQVTQMRSLVDQSEAELARLPGVITDATSQAAGTITTQSGEITEAGRQVGTDYSTGLSEGITQGGQQVSDSAAETAQGAIDSTKTTFDSHSPSKVAHDIGLDYTAGLAGGITEGGQTVGEAATGVAQGAVAAVETTLQGSVAAMQSSQAEIGASWSTWAAGLETAFAASLSAIGTTANTQMTALRTTLSTHTVGIETDWRTKWQAINTQHKTALDTIRNTTASVLAAIKTLNNTETNQIKTATITAANETVKGVATELAQLEPTVKDGYEPAIEYITGLIPKAKTWGADMMDGYIAGIRSKIRELEEVCEELASTVSEYMHFSRPDKGPLRYYEEWMPDMVEGMAEGIRANKGTLLGQVKEMTDQMAESLSGLGQRDGRQVINLSNRTVLELDRKVLASAVNEELGISL